MTKQLGTDHAVVLLSTTDSQGDLHHKCYRIGEYDAAEGDEEPGIIPQ